MIDFVRYTVVGTKEEVPGVVTVTLVGENGYTPTFIPGQYITVYFPDSGTPEGKAYSISSAPHEIGISITVRVIGDFSARIAALHAGDTLYGSAPYGFFYPEGGMDLAMIAGGIGITPFRSMIWNAVIEKPYTQMYLFRSTRNTADAIFKEDLEEIKADLGLKTLHFVTREEGEDNPVLRYGRMSAENILAHIQRPKETEFLLCGSISFTRDLWRGLKGAGVPEEHMYTEAFFTHA